MTLTEYIKSFPRRERITIRQKLAEALGISEVYVRSMCNRNKPLLAK